MNNLVLFCDTYRRNLTKARTEHPQEYPWPIEQLQEFLKERPDYPFIPLSK